MTAVPTTIPVRQRQPPLRDRKHLDSLRDIPCLLCNSLPSEPAHIRFGGDGGIGQKPGDDAAIPLCHRHHDMQHRIGEAKFWKDWLALMNQSRQGRAFVMQRIARSFA
jgi:hypothetical protein